MEPSTLKMAQREATAIHMYFCRDMTLPEIADKIDVSKSTVSRYINSEPSQEVQSLIAEQAAEVRIASMQELRTQLREVGTRARSAEKPVKVWTDGDGDLRVNDKVNPETGDLVGKYPVPHDMEMGPDQQARYYSREEAREILEHMEQLVGAREPEQVEVSGGGLVIDLGDDD